MYRIDNSTATTVIPTPGAIGSSPNSFFTGGNPATSTPATIVDADWLNAIQEEIANAITGAGLTLSKTNRSQLLQAVQFLGKGVQIWSTYGTYSFTVPANVTKIRGSVLGGGAGASGQSAGQTGAAGGGGGGLAEGFFPVTPGQVITVIVGKGGTGGAAGLTSGVAGTTSSLGALCSATGGLPGVAVSGSAAGGGPGSGFGGYLNLPGSSGGDGFIGSGIVPGYGGPGPIFGCITRAGTFTLAAAGNANAPGSGGSGSYYSGLAVGGGAGSDGQVIVEW